MSLHNSVFKIHFTSSKRETIPRAKLHTELATGTGDSGEKKLSLNRRKAQAEPEPTLAIAAIPLAVSLCASTHSDGSDSAHLRTNQTIKEGV